jgi:beta-lactamase class A
LSLTQKIHIEESDIFGRTGAPIRQKYPHGGGDLTIRELLEYMVTHSDGVASDILLRVLGGPSQITKYLRDLGITEIDVVTTEREQGQDEKTQYRNWATPIAMTELLGKLQSGAVLSESHRELLLHLMTITPYWRTRIRGLLPEGTPVASKSGSSGTVDGFTAATNDVGLITLPNRQHLAISVFVSDSTVSQEAGESVIALGKTN